MNDPPPAAADIPAGFPRTLGVVGVLFLTLSVATPASSVFVIAPQMLHVAGTGALWALILAGAVGVATAFIYAELSSRWPVAGGEYVMVAHTVGPFAGFLMLGINVFNNIIFLPYAALGIGEVVGSVVPDLPAIPVAIAVLVGCSLLAVLDVRLNAFVTGCFLVVEVVTLTIVAALGWGAAVRAPTGFLLHPQALQHGALVPVGLSGIGVATAVALFALNGYGSAVYFAEEMRDAPRRIAGAVLWAFAATLLLVGLPVVGALVGAGDLAALFAADNPFGALIAARGSTRLEQWVSIGVAVAIVNAVIAWVVACARFSYSTARDGCWGRPIDRWLVAVDPRFGSPWLGTLIVGGVSIALCFVDRDLLGIWSGTGLIVIYAGIALATVAARRRGLIAAAPYRMPLYPLAPLVTFAGLALVLWATWLDPVDGRPALYATAAQIVASALYYALVVRRRGAWQASLPAT